MKTKTVALILLSMSAGCGGQDGIRTEDMPIAADDSVTSSAITSSVTFGTTLQTTADLNLRTGPSTSYSVKLVMPSGSQSTAVQSSPTNGWYEVNYQGHVGWASGAYLVVAATPSTARDQAIARGNSVWGFSYSWGGGAWDPTSQSPGSCTGTCPSCTHSGSWGADCSGFLAKAWVVPSSNTPLTLAYHPYSTYDFRYNTYYWTQISRGSTIRADALVYNDTSSGHTFLFVSGDPWNSMNALECKGCSSGCVYDTRTASSAYVAIRRNGY